MGDDQTPLEKKRRSDEPLTPPWVAALKELSLREEQIQADHSPLFTNTSGQPVVYFEKGRLSKKGLTLRVGVLLSGGQAAGGHNVITGLYDGIKKIDSKSTLVGFLGGPGGLVDHKYQELTENILAEYRNTGGFDLIGSGRTKIETEEQFKASLKVCEQLKLDGLVIIGGDDSNTNAAFLAEFFVKNGCSTKVIGVPKTIDGDVKNPFVEISFGFDTASKTYSEMIGNIERDAISAKKYYHFIKLMGRSASHIALECALQTHPNVTLIGEEIAAEQKTLSQVTEEIAGVIESRSKQGRDYGVVLIPEGVIEFIPEIKALIAELNVESRVERLSSSAQTTFKLLPKEVQQQLLLDRDPHGNVQVSHVATEQLLIHTVKEALKKRGFSGKFNPIAHFLGYEGRSAFPSHFDANYCYALGHVASALIAGGRTGYMCFISNLAQGVAAWKGGGVPLTALLGVEKRKGKDKWVIRKALVDLKGAPFQHFSSQREKWKVQDHYRFPGPIQFYGPAEICQQITISLELEAQLTRGVS